MSKTNVLEASFSRWGPQAIRAAIHMRGMTLTKLAVDNGLSESACRHALNRPLPKADMVISSFLGVSLNELWPDRYDENGALISHERDQNSADQSGAHRQIQRAV